MNLGLELGLCKKVHLVKRLNRGNVILNSSEKQPEEELESFANENMRNTQVG